MPLRTGSAILPGPVAWVDLRCSRTRPSGDAADRALHRNTAQTRVLPLTETDSHRGTAHDLLARRRCIPTVYPSWAIVLREKTPQKRARHFCPGAKLPPIPAKTKNGSLPPELLRTRRTASSTCTQGIPSHHCRGPRSPVKREAAGEHLRVHRACSDFAHYESFKGRALYRTANSEYFMQELHVLHALEFFVECPPSVRRDPQTCSYSIGNRVRFARTGFRGTLLRR